MFSLFAKISESFLRGHRILYVSKMIMFFSFYVASTFCSVGSVSLPNSLEVYLPQKVSGLKFLQAQNTRMQSPECDVENFLMNHI